MRDHTASRPTFCVSYGLVLYMLFNSFVSFVNCTLFSLHISGSQCFLSNDIIMTHTISKWMPFWALFQAYKLPELLYLKYDSHVCLSTMPVCEVSTFISRERLHLPHLGSKFLYYYAMLSPNYKIPPPLTNEISHFSFLIVLVSHFMVGGVHFMVGI